MKSQEGNQGTTITVQISSEVSEELEAMARETERSTVHLAREAISDFVKSNSRQVARNVSTTLIHPGSKFRLGS